MVAVPVRRPCEPDAGEQKSPYRWSREAPAARSRPRLAENVNALGLKGIQVVHTHSYGLQLGQEASICTVESRTARRAADVRHNLPALTPIADPAGNR